MNKKGISLFIIGGLFMSVFTYGNSMSPAADKYTLRLAQAIKRLSPNSQLLYQELYNIHQDACREKIHLVYPQEDVNHSGKTIKLLVSHETAQSIPLPDNTNFNGWTIEVDATNSAPDYMYLFRFSENRVINIPTLDKTVIDSGHFEKDSRLNNGTKLLILEDRTPWTYRNDTPDTYFPNNRKGTPWQNWNQHDPKYRRDILLLENGIARNKTIAPYNTSATSPYCKYVDVSNEKKHFQHVTLHRVCKNGKVVRLLHICYANNVELSDIRIETEPSTAINDACITFIDATNVTVRDFTIQKTYSTVNNYGYGMDMNNVWNTHIINMNATSPAWGVLGNNNMNTVRLDNCSINRFDVHCYTRDIICHNCTFRSDNYLEEIKHHKKDLENYHEHNYHIFNRFSSLYGSLTYDHCTFDGFYPFLNDFAYNIHSNFDISFKECTMNIYQNKYAYLMKMGFWGVPTNCREEHAIRCLPNVFIDGMTFNVTKDISNIYIFFLMDRFDWNWGQIRQKINYISSIQLNNIKVLDMYGNIIDNSVMKEINLDAKRIKFAQNVRRNVRL